MTLYELWLVIAKRWKLVVLVPVICALACFGYLMLNSHGGESAASYTATSRIVANSQVQAVAGLAASEARQYVAQLYGDHAVDDSTSGMAETSDLTIATKGDSASMTITITASGFDPDACVQAANAVAEAAEASAEEAFAAVEEPPYVGKVELAVVADIANMDGGRLKYLLVALLGGLFVAICIAVVFDMMKRPVKTAEGAQESVALPVLEILPAANGERLLANVRFAAKNDGLSSVFVVPAGDVQAAYMTCDLLTQASTSEKGAQLTAECGTPLSDSMRSAYDARMRDAVVVAVRQWADTLPLLESTVAELKLADANLVGLVFVKEKLGQGRHGAKLQADRVPHAE